jgi:hypothetical protein
MWLLYARSMRLAIKNVSSARPLPHTYQAEWKASERAGIELARVPSCPLEFILYHLRFRPPWCDS